MGKGNGIEDREEGCIFFDCLLGGWMNECMGWFDLDAFL